MSFKDKAKVKAEEWDIEGKAEKLASELGRAAHEAKVKAAQLADENRDKVAGVLDKAGAKIDERTEGKYSDKIAKAKEQVNKGVSKLAEQRPTTRTSDSRTDPFAQTTDADPANPASPDNSDNPWAQATQDPWEQAPETARPSSPGPAGSASGSGPQDSTG